MATKQPKNRSEMDQAYQWDLAAMIPDESVLDGQLAQIREEAEKYQQKFCGHLTENGQVLAAAYAEKDDLWRRLEKIYV